MHLPEPQYFDLPHNPKLADFYLTKTKSRTDFLKNEKKLLISQIQNLFTGSFSEIRDKEINRLSKYYYAASELYDIDFEALARTRIQTTGSIMLSTAFFLQSLFENNPQTDDTKGASFFESRINTGGVQFNATSVTNIDGLPMGFSVLKRSASDEYGNFGIDLPAISLPRQALAELLFWHKENYPNIPFRQNPIISLAIELFSIRIHDWFHAAVIYDSQSLTKVFQKWSDNSFFVEHLFDEPNMINYEYISDKVHHSVWQYIFSNEPEAKIELLKKIEEYLNLTESLEKWMFSQKSGDETSKKSIINFLNFVGLRGIFHAIPFNSKDLLPLKKNHSGVSTAIELLPKKIVKYLTGIYSEEFGKVIPFRMGGKNKLTLKQILTEYTDGLYEEARLYRHKELIKNIWDLSIDGDLTRIMKKLPKQISQNLKDVELSEYDPKIFKMLNSLLTNLSSEFGSETTEYLITQTEISPETGFYFKVDIDELVPPNTADYRECEHRKYALLTQVPYDFENEIEIKLHRPRTLLTTEEGAVSTAKPGDAILINVQDKNLATSLVNAGKVGGNFDFSTFWNNFQNRLNKGNNSIKDSYTYDIEKLIKIYELAQKDAVELDSKKRKTLATGFYASGINIRLAAAANGPISLNAPGGSNRRRILKGAIVKNHVQSKIDLDMFPVDQKAFELFYSEVNLSKLPHFKVKDDIKTKYDIPSQVNLNKAIEAYLKALEIINTFKIYGNRGKPPKNVFGDLVI